MTPQEEDINVVTVGSLSDSDRIKAMLNQSVRAPGINPQNTFVLLAKLLEDEFSDGDTTESAKRFIAFVRNKGPMGMGLEPGQLLKIVNDLKHPHEIEPHKDKEVKTRMDWMRRRVAELTLAAQPVLKAEQAEAAPLLANLGSNQYDRGPDEQKNVRPSKDYGNSSAYRLGILKRDHPEVAEGYSAGKYKSVTDAFRAAGLSPPLPSRTLTALRTQWSKATPEDRQTFLDEVTKPHEAPL